MVNILGSNYSTAIITGTKQKLYIC